MTRKLITLLWTAVLLLSSCNYPVSQKGAPQAWIDDPLDGMHLPLQPYTLTLHSSDPLGISLMEIRINGENSVLLSNPDSNQLLVYLTYKWEPAAPGRYLIRVRSQNTSGVWSKEDVVVVEIEGISTPTITIIPSDTSTPVVSDTPTLVISDTPTLTATKTPTGTKIPTPIPSEISFIPGLSTNQFYFGSCQPNQIDVSVQLSNTVGVNHVELFVRLLDNNSSDSTAWDSYGVMSDNGNGLYRIALKSSNITGANRFTSSVVLYQFIAVGTKGKVLGRSPSYNDLSLNTCGGIILPPGGFTIVPRLPTDIPTLIPPPP